MTPTASPIDVAVVDDNGLIADSVERWLSGSPGYRFHGGFTATDPALRSFAINPPCVVMLDVDIPGSDSFAFLRRIVAGLPRTKVVMLSGHVRPDYIARALDAGAAGYIVKDEGIPLIMELVRRAVAGEVVLSSSAKRSLAELC